MNNVIKVTHNHSSTGIGFVGLLTILFIALKLTNTIEWSWLWVLSPLWVPLATVITLGLAFVLIAGIIGGLIGMVDYFKKRKRK